MGSQLVLVGEVAIAGSAEWVLLRERCAILMAAGL
jgi:hypothetical protein